MKLPAHIESKLREIQREENLPEIEAIRIYEELSKLADIMSEDLDLKLKAA